MHFPSCAKDDKKLPYTIETATLTRKLYPMLRTTIQSLNLFLPGLIYGPKICIETVQLHSYLLRIKGAFIFIIIIIIHILFYFFTCIKRANSLFMLSDFHSQPATAVLTFFRVKYHFHVNYTTCINTIGSTYEPFFHRNQPLDFY